MKKLNRTHNCLKTRVFSLFLSILTVLVTILSPLGTALPVYAAPDYPDEILIDLDMAQESLQELLSEKDIFALVYLCDTFDVKSEPDTQSDTVVTLGSGQAVQITGIDQDEEYNIWYQVHAELPIAVADELSEDADVLEDVPVNVNSYDGYFLRDHLAYSDEDLLNWELDQIMELSFSLFSLRPEEETQVATSTIPEDIQAFPISYQSALLALKEKHPNWTFVAMKTGLDWNQAVQAENSKNRSLLHSANEDHLLNGSYDSSWSYPTNGALAYYLDPRNFLTENGIFQFEFLSYNKNYHTEASVQSILKGTFMDSVIPDDVNGRTYAQAFCQIATELNVSPFHLASRVRQEQGVQGTSALISGTYEKYPGVYNYFNVGATGKGTTQNIETGLAKATECGWTTRYASLYGGASLIANRYILLGQNTLYLQKFNVSKNAANPLYTHQYMQNIKAPSSEATSIRSAYATASSLNNPFVFSIPVYENMPANSCPLPKAAKELSLSQNSFSLKADETAALSFCLDGLVTSASSLTFTSSDPAVASISSQGVITAGNAGTATITCTAPGAASVTCTVSVSKTAPSVTAPVLNAVTYAPTQTLQDISLPEGWTWDNPSIVPTVENAGYPATYTPSNSNKYEVVKTTLSLTVKKGTPEYQIPTGLTTVEGNTLACLKLPAGFSWVDPSTVLQKSGEYPATYNPDEANYETVTGLKIPVTVNLKDVTCTRHVYGEWIVTTPATCGKDGEQEHFCNICGAKQTESIPALEHYYSSVVTKAPTETETGIRTFTCEYCKDSYTEIIDKLPESHKHSYTMEITTPATCTQTGTKTFTCSCKDTYTETIPALGHNYTSQVTKEPTETSEGIRTYTCSRCQDSYTETIAKLPSSHKHSYTETITKQATCTEKGLKTFTCSCKDSYTEEIPALGHDMADGKCRRCGYTEPRNTQNNTPNTQTPTASETNPAAQTVTPSETTNTVGTTTPAGETPETPEPDSATQVTGQQPVSAPQAVVQQPAVSKAENELQDKPEEEPQEEGQLTATLNMKNNTVLYEETLTAVRGRDVEIVLQMSDQVSWTIQGSNIVSDEANGIDMGVRINAEEIPSEIMKQASKLSETGNVIELSLAHDGPMDFKPMLTIETNKANAGRMATLFYFNPSSEELEFMDEVEINETGAISFTFEHASDYAVVISETGLANYSVITADGAFEAVNEGLDSTLSDEISTGMQQMSEESTGKKLPDINSSTLLIIAGILLLVIALGIIIIFVSCRKRSQEGWEDLSDEDQTGNYYDAYEGDYGDTYEDDFNATYKGDFDDDCEDDFNDDCEDDFDDDCEDDFDDDYLDPVSETDH